jgi:hypothetical protein
LDFFAGSGTTAHAVYLLNAEDGGKRRCISVQISTANDAPADQLKNNPEDVADLCKKRLSRAGATVSEAWRKQQDEEQGANGMLPGLVKSAPSRIKPDTGFRVLKIDISNMRDVYYAPDAVEQGSLLAQVDNIRPDRTPEDLLFHVLVDQGVDLALPIAEETITGKKVFFVDGNALAACFDDGITDELVKEIAKRQPLKAVYVDDNYGITPAYHAAKEAGTVAPLPSKLTPYATPIFQLIDSVYCESQLPDFEDGRKGQKNPLNANFQKKEFQALWNRIHQKAVYSVHFETAELIAKCVAELDSELKVAPLQYVVQRGEQIVEASFEALQAGEAFRLEETQTAPLKASVHSAVKYDLIGKLAEETKLTRTTIGVILKQIMPSTFGKYRVNPEDFLRNAARLINEQKATVIVEHLTYSAINETYGIVAEQVRG